MRDAANLAEVEYTEGDEPLAIHRDKAEAKLDHESTYLKAPDTT